MQSFKFKEEDLAKYIEKHGFVSKHRQSELNALAAYWYTERELRGKKLKDALIEFCEKNDASFRVTRDYAMISKALKQATKKALIQIDSCPVYKEELKWIADFPLGRVFQKALFVILIQKRIENMLRLGIEKGLEEPLVPVLLTTTKSFKEMVKGGSFPAKLNFDKDILFELAQRGLITPLYRGKVALDYLKDMPQGEEVAYQIKNFDEAGLIFDHWVGDPKVELCACGAVFKKNSNRQKMCVTCREEAQREFEKAYNLKRKAANGKNIE